MNAGSPIDPTLKGVVWKKTRQELAASHPAIASDDAADLVVVGGGFCGLSAALQAAKAGLSVILLEAGAVGSGASGRNGGFVVPHFPGSLTPAMVSNMIGPKKGAALAELVMGGAEAAYRTIAEHGIECHAEQTGWIQPAHSASALARIRAVFDQWRSLGATVRWLDEGEVGTLTGAVGYRGGWTNPAGGTVNPYSLALGLARAAAACGVRLYENSRATGYEVEGGGTAVLANGHRVKGRSVLVATNGYANAALPAVQRSVIPVHLFHVATTPLTEDQLKIVLPRRHCFTDLRKSGGFGRLDSDNRLISGGAVFALGNSEAYGLAHVKRRIAELFPSLGAAGSAIETYWDGYCAVTQSSLPHVHVLGRDFLAVGGFSTRGVNLAQAIGRVLGHHAAGRSTLDDIPLAVHDGRRDVPFWAAKTRAARLLFPVYQLRDRLGLS